MSKPEKLYRDKQQGIQAQYLLNDSVLLAALDAMREDAIVEWEKAVGSRPDDVATRERLHMRVQMVAEFRHRLAMMVADGKRAQSELDKT